MALTITNKSEIKFEQNEIIALIKGKFGLDGVIAFEKYYSEINKHRWLTEYNLNLFYFGPREKDCLNDPEEREQKEKHFPDSMFTKEELFVKDILHFIWDTIEAEGHDVNIEMIKFI